MEKLLNIGLILAVLAVLGAPSSASATPLYTFIGDCGSANCFGSTYTLIIGDANDAQNTTYTARLIIDTTGYNYSVPAPAYIDAVDFKVVNSLIGNTYSLVEAPGGASNWLSYFDSGQAANDCGNGGGFKVCARDPDPNNLAQVGGVLTWDWTFSSNDQISFGHIGASYNNAAGSINGNNTSIHSATLPAPTTVLLLGAGLIVLSGVARKFDPPQSKPRDLTTKSAG